MQIPEGPLAEDSGGDVEGPSGEQRQQDGAATVGSHEHDRIHNGDGAKVTALQQQHP